MSYFPKIPRAPKKEPPMPTIKPDFADISHWEKIDLDRYEFKTLITKATEGLNYVDPTFKKLQESCRGRGIEFGAYHFFRSNLPPKSQARHFMDIVGEFDLPPILDVESEDGVSHRDRVGLIKAFLNEVEDKTSKTPIIYSGYSFLKSMNLSDEFTKYPLWLARYTNVPPAAPYPWKKYWAWQFSDKAFFKGIGEADGNVFWKE